MNLIDGISRAHCLGNHEDTSIGRLSQCFIHICDMELLVTHITMSALTDHTQTLLDSLLERAAYSHNLADTLHAGTDLAGNTVELRKVPTRNLADDIVEGRLEEGRSRLGHGVLQVEKTVAQTELRCHECERITCRFGGQCR